MLIAAHQQPIKFMMVWFYWCMDLQLRVKCAFSNEECLNSIIMTDLSLLYFSRSRRTTHFNFARRNQHSAGASFQMSHQYYKSIDTDYYTMTCGSTVASKMCWKVIGPLITYRKILLDRYADLGLQVKRGLNGSFRAFMPPFPGLVRIDLTITGPGSFGPKI